MFIDQELKVRMDQVYETIHDIQKLKMDIWMEDILFSFQWWLGICLTIIPWILWFIFRDKKSGTRMLFVGFFALIVSSCLDFLGIQLGLWRYYYEVFPWAPSYVPWDGTLIPVLILFLIEFKPNVSPWIKAVIFSLFTSFIAEPLFFFLGLYKPINWEYLYSVPIFFIIYLVCHFLSTLDGFDHVKKGI